MRLTVLIFLALLAIPSPVLAQSSGFFEALYDVPVMKGLQEVPAETMLFDKPDGRIATVVAASSSLKTQDILQFYGQTLPQMGWKKTKENQYVRDGEQLLMEIVPGHPVLAVRFTLSPAGL